MRFIYVWNSIFHEFGFAINESSRITITLSLYKHSICQIRSFICMGTLHRRFISAVPLISEPLIILARIYTNWSRETHVKLYIWSAEERYFNKCILYSVQTLIMILDYIRMSLNFIYVPVWHCGFRKFIYYFSHKLSDTQTRWSTTEKGI